MLDFSSNNGKNHNYKLAFFAGQRRAYVKTTEGDTYFNPLEHDQRLGLIAAGFKVGAYHFAQPEHNSPLVEADNFLNHLYKLDYRYHLAPCLDIEVGHPDKAVGVWAKAWLAAVKKETGRQPVIYSYASFLQLCEFATVPAPLWLASFGRNDGREYPFYTPAPWKTAAAHQYSSNARVRGITGRVDISHVFDFGKFDLKRRAF